MHQLKTRSALASLGVLAALAVTACADPVAPASLVESPSPVAAVGPYPGTSMLQETFGSGIDVSGGRDQRVEVQEGGSGSFVEAYVLAKNPRWADPITGTQWVGPSADAASKFAEPRQDDIYRVTFTLPDNYVDAALNVDLYADNVATLYVNGVQFGMQPTGDQYKNYGCLDPTPAPTCGDGSPSNFGPYGTWYTTSGFHAGVNTLTIQVANEEFKQGCEEAGSPNPLCKSATGVDFLAGLYYDTAEASRCDFITFGRLVVERGGKKIVISGNAGGNAPGGGILGELEISVGGTKYHVHTVSEYYMPIAADNPFGGSTEYVRVIKGTSIEGSPVVLILRDDPRPGQGEPGRSEGDQVYLKIGSTVIVGAGATPNYNIDQGNVQLHLNCRGPK